MSYGLVRQVGPWPLTASDIQKVLHPQSVDPSDYQSIRPYVVHDGATQPIVKSVIAQRTVLLPPADDPRVSVPGRKIGIDRALGAKREPMESKGILTALSGGGALQLKIDPQTGEVISDQPSLLTKPANDMPSETPAQPAPMKQQGPLPPRKMTPDEMGAWAINGIADALPYVIPFLW